MRPAKSRKSYQAEATSIATTVPGRYCNRCHLSTPKANPRCIHCRCFLTIACRETRRVEDEIRKRRRGDEHRVPQCRGACGGTPCAPTLDIGRLRSREFWQWPRGRRWQPPERPAWQGVTST